MVKIVRIMGVAIFLLTVSSNVWAGVDEPASPTPRPHVTVPRSTRNPTKGGYKYYHDARHPDNYYHNDDIVARHPYDTTLPPTSTITIPILPKPKPGETAKVCWFGRMLLNGKREEWCAIRYTPRELPKSAPGVQKVVTRKRASPTPTATPTPSPTPTQAPASNRHIPK